LRVPSFSTGNRQSSWLPFWRAPNPPLRLASAGTPARDDRCGDRLPPFLSRSRRVRRHALFLLSFRCVSSQLCSWSVYCPLKHFSCTSTYLRTSQPYHNDPDATILFRAMTLSNTLLEAPSISIFRPASYKAFPFEPLPFPPHTRVLQTSTSFVR
jgi:hypothetical protein